MKKYLGQIITGVTIAVASPIILLWLGVNPVATGVTKTLPANNAIQKPVVIQPEPQPIRVIVHNHLGYEQVSNQITVTLGNETRVLSANMQNQLSETVFTLPGSGTYDFNVQAEALFNHEYKPLHMHIGSGQGQITVQGGETIDLGWNYDWGYQPFRVSMVTQH